MENPTQDQLKELQIIANHLGTTVQQLLASKPADVIIEEYKANNLQVLND